MTSNILPDRVTNLKVHGDLVHCPICGFILWKPVTCTTCENSFCFNCIQLWLFEQQEQIIEYLDNENLIDYVAKSFSLTRCPFNCSPYIQRKCPPLLTTILSTLTIECRNKIYGCQEILFYEQLEKHEEEFCRFRIIQCPGCKQNMFKEIFDKDKHLLKCSYVKIKCTKCQGVFQRQDKHDQFDCMEGQICLLKQQLIVYEEKSSKIYDIQRKKLDILDEKFTIIEQVWVTDDDDDDHINRTTKHTFISIQSNKYWSIIIGLTLAILILFLYILFF
ncbi:hypothetical protein I4U23_021620 [Adineta vaga]|nr:hypothetical protein I4U23_021620 [Adineta vaga]